MKNAEFKLIPLKNNVISTSGVSNVLAGMYDGTLGNATFQGKPLSSFNDVVFDVNFESRLTGSQLLGGEEQESYAVYNGTYKFINSSEDDETGWAFDTFGPYWHRISN